MKGIDTLTLAKRACVGAAEYGERRQRLLGLLLQSAADPLVVLGGFGKSFSAPEVPHVFRQCSHFRYLTGCLEPRSRLVLTRSRAVLFLHERSPHEQLWDGAGTSVAQLQAESGVDEVLPLPELAPFLVSALSAASALAADPRGLPDPDVQRLLDGFPGPRLPLLPEVDRLRWVKSPAELEAMRAAAVVGSQALNALLAQARHVPQEAHLVGLLEWEMRRRGANFQAYPPVVASGARANIIHYIESNQAVRPGDCVLLDAGADFQGYCSDITRCFPVDGRFSAPQRELYEALTEVHESCLHFAEQQRPLKLNDLYMHMMGSMATVLKSIFFFNKSLTDPELISACSRLCEHHVSHYLGMDVHDTPSVSRTCAIPAGVVITVEPGIYVRADNPDVRPEFVGTGFRIEDDVLVTDSGTEVLSRGAVRKADEVEKLLNS